jgi:hypothetical protein
MDHDPDEVRHEAEEVQSAVAALGDIGDEESFAVLKLISRLLADDWTGSGVYEALDAALKAAEESVSS